MKKCIKKIYNFLTKLSGKHKHIAHYAHSKHQLQACPTGRLKSLPQLVTSWPVPVPFELENVPVVEFMYLVFTRTPCESSHRQLRSLMVYLC